MKPDPTITLWSIQTQKAADQLQLQGELVADWEFADPDFHNAYWWMIVQYQKYHHLVYNRPLIWAWVRKPDLRHKALLETGTKGVRLKLEVPRSKILFSDFHDWHYVLNNMYLPTKGESQKWTEAQWDRAERSPYKIRESWSRIFRKNPDDQCQACIPSIFPEYVKDATYFTAR